MAAGAPSVAVHDGLDDATAQFLLSQTLLAMQQEDEEAKQAKEVTVWEVKVAEAETRILEEIDPPLHPPRPYLPMVLGQG